LAAGHPQVDDTNDYLLFADELLIMSMVATGLQQQLDARQDFCSYQIIQGHVLHKYGAGTPRTKVRLDLNEKVSQRQVARSN